MSAHLQRAELLLGQKRPEDAAASAREGIAEDPENPWGYYFLARALEAQDAHEKALEAVDAALARDASEPNFHLARVMPLLSLRRSKEAEQAARTTLELRPDEPGAFNALSWTLIQQKRWQEAFDAATEGLRFEPDHPGLSGARAQAERQLGKTVDAHQTLERALARDPENAFTHYQLGWTWLQRKDSEKAMKHFSEALRIDPTFEDAKAGLAEAMKARNLFYRGYLSYAFFMSRLAGKWQWAIWIGAYFVIKFSIRASNEMGQPALGFGIAGLYLFFIWSSWTLDAVFNLLLRLDRLGRHALNDDQRRGANLSAVLMGTAILCDLAAIIPGKILFLGPALGALMMMLPGAALFRYGRMSNRVICGAYLGLQTIGLLAAIVLAATNDLDGTLTAAGLVYVSSLIYTWLGAGLNARD